MKNNIKVNIYEDNAGGLHAVIYEGDTIINIINNMEYDRHLSSKGLIEATKYGFDFADEYNPDDCLGLDMDEYAVRIGNGCTRIAEIYEDGHGEYDYDHMGIAGHLLFDDLLDDDDYRKLLF